MVNLPPVSIVIPVFGNKAIERGQLVSVFRALEAYPSGGEVVIAVDVSTNYNRTALLQEFPSLLFWEHDNSDGWETVVSLATECANHDALVFLNPDVYPEPDFILPLIGRLLENQVFCVQSAIFDERRNIDPYCLARCAFRWGTLRRFPTRELGKEGWLSLHPCGGSMVFDRLKLVQLGLGSLITTFWGGSDLGLRAWRRGWETWLEPRSVGLLSVRESKKNSSEQRRIRCIRQRNKLLVEWIHFPLYALLAFGIPKLLFKVIFSLIVGDFGYFVALSGAFSIRSQVRRIRSEIKSTERLSFHSILVMIANENAMHTELERKSVRGCCNV